MMYKLFLDDFRKPSDAANYMPQRTRFIYRDLDWDIVRNYDQFVSTIERRGLPDLVSFDHDLADEHYAPTGISYDDFKERTGYHCMQWMIEHILENKLPCPQVLVHSLNPVGGENIENLFRNFKKHYKCPDLNE